RLRVESAVAAGDALDDEARVPVDQDAHTGTSWALAITARTPSSIEVVAERPASARILRAAASLVPVNRITSGTESAAEGAPSPEAPWSAVTIPRATSSQRVMPPKMLNR